MRAFLSGAGRRETKLEGVLGVAGAGGGARLGTEAEMLSAVLHKLRRAGIDIKSPHRRAATSPLAVIQRVLADQEVKVLLDCGAHHGRVTQEFKHLFPAARVFAFEPTPQTYEVARANLAGMSGVELVNEAVGEKSGVVNFYTLDHTESNSMVKRSEDAACIEVKQCAIGDFCRERGIGHIDVLK